MQGLESTFNVSSRGLLHPITMEPIDLSEDSDLEFEADLLRVSQKCRHIANKVHLLNMQTYKSAEIDPNDNMETKIKTLYVGICSVGDQLYSAGSLLSEINKKLLDLEGVVADFRRELEKIKSLAR